MTFDEAKSRVLHILNHNRASSASKLVLLEDRTISKGYGWIFFYNSKAFVETGDVMHALGGNGPIVVESATGRVTRLGTARPIEEEIADFERLNGLQ